MGDNLNLLKSLSVNSILSSAKPTVNNVLKASTSANKEKSVLSQNQKFEIKLVVDAKKQKGVLIFSYLQSKRVRILHISSKGDALINDGSNVLMINSSNVTMVSEDEATEGRRRLEFVKHIYSCILSGELVDTNQIFLEIQKWML